MIDTSKLSKALRVGGAGIRAEHVEDHLFSVWLPDGQILDEADGRGIGYPKKCIEDPEPRTTEDYPLAECLRELPNYQTWLKRAKCEHVWPFHGSISDGTENCTKCGAQRRSVLNGHYTLLPEPAARPMVCPTCGRPKGTRLCMDPFHRTEPGDVCAVVWCGGPVATHGNPLCSGCWRKWINAPFVKPIGYNWTVEDDRRAWAAKQSEGGGAKNAVPQQSGAPIAGPGDEPGSVHTVITAKCKECGAPNADVLKELCVYCERRLNSIESARADLDRPLPERIERARRELGFHDGFGVYSLPGEPK